MQAARRSTPERNYDDEDSRFLSGHRQVSDDLPRKPVEIGRAFADGGCSVHPGSNAGRGVRRERGARRLLAGRGSDLVSAAMSGVSWHRGDLPICLSCALQTHSAAVRCHVQLR